VSHADANIPTSLKVEDVPRRLLLSVCSPTTARVTHETQNTRSSRFSDITTEFAMPHQNRVTPFGEIVGVPDRGTLMGNRGVLHDITQTIRRSWQLKRWILCLTEFKNRRRTIMTPGWYTELFFLDEATWVPMTRDFLKGGCFMAN